MPGDEKLHELYERAGFRGVFDARGPKGVEDILNDWSTVQPTTLEAGDGRSIGIGAEFCYFGGPSIFTRGPMGVAITLVASQRHYGSPHKHVFLPAEADDFVKSLMEVAENTNYRSVSPDGRRTVLQVPLANYWIHAPRVHWQGVRQEMPKIPPIVISRSPASERADTVSLDFPGDSSFSGPITIATVECGRLRQLVQEAKDEVARFERAKARADRVIARRSSARAGRR